MTQAPNCMRRLFSCNSVPFATLESIIRRPKNAEPLKAIHNIRLNPLKGVWDSFNNFFFNSGSIFDINKQNYKINFISKYQHYYCRYSSAVEQLSRKQLVIGSIPIIGISKANDKKQ